MSSTNQNSTNPRPLPLNDSGTRTHETTSTARLDTKNPPKAK